MKYHVIDNSLKDLGKTVLWQYDRAVRLLSVMKHMQVLYHCAVEQFWDWWTKRVLSIDTLDAFGCSLWGMFLGVPHPTVKDKDGKEYLIATSVYRKVLKGAFYLTKASSSFEDMLGYLEIVFGVSGDDNLSKWSVYVSEYGWTTNIDELNDRYQPERAYEEGDIFWWSEEDNPIGSNWKCLRYIKAAENTSYQDILDAGWIEQTNEYTTGMRDDETVLLKLIDPEGIVRKIGGAPSDSLSVSVEYKMGETTIRAVATRRRKCGVSLTDNYNLTMSYSKSPYYDEMHKDQKALFEQKINEFGPLPLGIGDGRVVEQWVFGFEGQQNERYKTGVSYEEGHIFGYVDAEGHGFNWKCKEAISVDENTSFNAIKGKLGKTAEGAPFIGGLDSGRFFADIVTGFYHYRDLQSNQTHISCNIPKNGLVVCKDSSGISSLYRNIGESVRFSVHVKENVLPIETDVWKPYVDEYVSNLINTSSSFKKIPYNSGEAQNGCFYGDGMIVKVNGERKYVYRQGTYNNKSFSGELKPAMKTTFARYNTNSRRVGLWL